MGIQNWTYSHMGNGTGPELLAIFEKVIVALAAPYNVEVQFVMSPRISHCYSSLMAINDTDAVISALYGSRPTTRCEGGAFKLSSSTSILLVRDQAHGFYSGLHNIDSIHETVSRPSYFSKKVFKEIITFSLAPSHETWGSETHITTVTLVYKFHLFDRLFNLSARKWRKSYCAGIHYARILLDLSSKLGDLHKNP
ncbi:hypothetical protein N7471_009317 [Penicillium samsonianum]|uniref:uncharacterized protein n=1 Tax=Penicillium samsonianum TaxID=1882272 RepID=UPI0025467039|nr:uncharacterized protein N7471_009317 [Penicillium samsonianum]KAJ6128100.1 hypothetical protein N7471_009317 [Penicillium samsonianum]